MKTHLKVDQAGLPWGLCNPSVHVWNIKLTSRLKKVTCKRCRKIHKYLGF